MSAIENSATGGSQCLAIGVHLDVGDYFSASMSIYSDLTSEANIAAYDIDCSCTDNCTNANCVCYGCHPAPSRQMLQSPEDIVSSLKDPWQAQRLNLEKHGALETETSIGIFYNNDTLLLHLAIILCQSGKQEVVWEYDSGIAIYTARVYSNIPHEWRMQILQNMPPDVLLAARREVGQGMVFPPANTGTDQKDILHAECCYLAVVEPWAAAALVLNSVQEEEFATLLLQEMGDTDSTPYKDACASLVQLELSSSEKRSSAAAALPYRLRLKLNWWSAHADLLPSLRNREKDIYKAVDTALRCNRKEDPRWTAYLQELEKQTEEPRQQIESLKKKLKAGEISPGDEYYQNLQQIKGLWGWL